eukprot:11212158-Lingulodinium_polyedra.AAC.1
MDIERMVKKEGWHLRRYLRSLQQIEPEHASRLFRKSGIGAALPEDSTFAFEEYSWKVMDMLNALAEGEVEGAYIKKLIQDLNAWGPNGVQGVFTWTIVKEAFTG